MLDEVVESHGKMLDNIVESHESLTICVWDLEVNTNVNHYCCTISIIQFLLFYAH